MPQDVLLSFSVGLEYLEKLLCLFPILKDDSRTDSILLMTLAALFTTVRKVKIKKTASVCTKSAT